MGYNRLPVWYVVFAFVANCHLSTRIGPVALELQAIEHPYQVSLIGGSSAAAAGCSTKMRDTEELASCQRSIHFHQEAEK